MRRAIFVFLLYSAIILQTTLLPQVVFFGVQPDLICALLVCLCVVQSVWVAAITGALVGLVLDVMFMTPGFYTMQYLLLCTFISLLSQKIPFGRLVLPSIACFAGFTLKEMIILIYLYLQRVAINFPVAMGKLLFGALYTVLLMLPIYQGIQLLNKRLLEPSDTMFGHLKK